MKAYRIARAIRLNKDWHDSVPGSRKDSQTWSIFRMILKTRGVCVSSKHLEQSRPRIKRTGVSHKKALRMLVVGLQPTKSFETQAPEAVAFPPAVGASRIMPD